MSAFGLCRLYNQENRNQIITLLQIFDFLSNFWLDYVLVSLHNIYYGVVLISSCPRLKPSNVPGAKINNVKAWCAKNCAQIILPAF